MNKFVSPLRYPGGKLKVVDYIKKMFEVNDLMDGTYIEPYAGGASVALTLLFSEYANRIKINDIDRSIYAFWHSVLEETEGLCRLITDTPVTMAVKSHIRNRRPVVLNIATNDALAGSAKNIFSLINYKNYYFVPIRQDDHVKKPFSLMGDFSAIPEALAAALDNTQLQPGKNAPLRGSCRVKERFIIVFSDPL